MEKVRRFIEEVMDNGKYFKSINEQFVCPSKYVEIMTGHSEPEDWDGEDADIALERETNLMLNRLWVLHEVALIDKWIDECKEIQAIALQNKENTDGTT